MQKYTHNVNGDVPLTVENVWYFKFPFRSWCADVLVERKTNLIWSIVFFIKNIFIDIKFGSFIKRQTSGTSSENEWQRMVQRVTTNDNEWQQMTKSDNEW